jgi:hypothetical protein
MVARRSSGLPAWEVCGAAFLPPADSATCGDLDGLAVSDRDYPQALLRSGTQRARLRYALRAVHVRRVVCGMNDGWHLGVLLERLHVGERFRLGPLCSPSLLCAS